MAENPQPVATFTHDEQVSAVTFSADGRRLATLSNKTLRVFPVSGAGQPVIVPTDVELSTVAFAPTGTSVAVCGFGGFKLSVIVVDPATGSMRWRKTEKTQSMNVGFTPDGTAILVQQRTSAQLLDAASGTPRWTFAAQQGQTLHRAAFSPDGATVAIGTGMDIHSGEIVLLDAATGAVRKRVGRPNAVRAVCFYSGTGRFVGFGTDREVGILDTTSQAMRVLPHPEDELRDVLKITFSGDDRLIGMISERLNGIFSSARVLDADTLAVIRDIPEGSFWGRLEFGRDPRTLLTVESLGIRVWEVATGADLFCYVPTEADGGATDTTLDPTGRLVALSTGNSARIFELPARERLRLAHGGAVHAVRFSPDGQRLLTASADKTARVFELVAGTEQFRLTQDDAVVGACWIPARPAFATAGTDGTARIANSATGAQRASVAHPAAVTTLTASADGTRLATACADGTARLIDVDTATVLRRLTLDDAVLAVAFNPAGTRLAVGSADGTARVYNVATGAEVLSLAHSGAVSAVAFNPAGTRLATASADTTARLYDTASGTELHTLSHDGPVAAVDFTGDGSRLATASADGAARIFDTTTGAELRRFPHGGPVTAVTFTPDGSRLATASADAARIFEATTGAELRKLPHDGAVTALAVNAAGTQLATASADATARLYDIPT